MEELLKQLLVPDNNTITQATDALRKSLKNPESILLLCSVLQNSEHAQIRQYAAVVLRKRFTKRKNWEKLPDITKNAIKEGMLPVLSGEKEKSVKTSVAQLTAVVAKHELQQNRWPELLKYLGDLITNADVNNVGLGMFTISVLTDIALDVFIKNPDQLCYLLQHVFNSLNDLSSVVGYYTVITMSHTVPLCESCPQLRTLFAKAVPLIMTGIKNLIPVDEDKAVDCFGFFDVITDNAAPLISPHLPTYVEFCFEIASNPSLTPSLRNIAINQIGWLSNIKRKLFIKYKLIKPSVDVVFNIMCESGNDGDSGDEDWFADDDDDITPWKIATSVLAQLAINLPAQKVLDAVRDHVSAGLSSQQKHVQKSSYLALAMMAEGAAECIKTKYLNAFFNCVKAGITDESSSVIRNAALYALGQFAEHLQPEISDYANEIMPILLQYLEHVCKRLEKGSQVPRTVHSMFYALEVFCENLEEKLLTYLPNVVEKLLLMLSSEHPPEIQELAISCIGSAALAVNTEFMPFFPDVMAKLNIYLIKEDSNGTLQVQALDTLAVLTRSMGAEYMAPLARDTMDLGLKMLMASDDPDLKRSAYGLFASLASVVKAESAAFLPQLIEMLILSLKSTEGIVADPGDDDASAFPVYDDLSDSAEEEDIANESDVSSDSDVHYSLENSYTAEKEEAIIALKELALHAGEAFIPYLERSFEETLKLVMYPHEDIRKAAIEALAQFSVNFCRISSPEGHQAMIKALSIIVPKCEELIHKDEDENAAAGCLEALKLILEEIGAPVIELGYRDVILKCVISVLSNKTMCQERGEDEEVDIDDDGERYEFLMQTAGDILPALGKALSANDFVASLQVVMPYILPKLKDTCSISQRSYFIGTLAECMSFAGPYLEQNGNICIDLLSVFSPLSKDSDPEVRNNAIYGLGELVLHSKHQLYPKYMEILEHLSRALSNETRPGTIDNICGALARLIVTNVDLIPMAEVFPVLLERLPLKEDLTENGAILKCFGHLYQLGNQFLLANIAQIIKICCLIINEKKRNTTEVLQMAAVLLNNCQKDFPSDFTTVISSLPLETATNIASTLNSVNS